MSDISRKKEPHGRTRFLSDDERTALLEACAKSEWPALHALVLLAITTGARKGELIALKWVDIDLKTHHVCMLLRAARKIESALTASAAISRPLLIIRCRPDTQRRISAVIES